MKKRKALLTGEVCLKCGRLEDAWAFQAARQELTTDRFIAIGDRCVEEGWLADARRAFQAAGQQVCGEGLARRRP